MIAQTTETRKMSIQSESDASKNYYLTIRIEDNIAIDCTCPDSFHRHHACKHQRRHNNLVAYASIVSFLRNFAASVQEAMQAKTLANEIERLHRERAKAEKALQSEQLAAMPEQVKEVVECEVRKCVAVREQQVAVQAKRPETAEDWKAVVRRQKQADRAFAQQYRKSAQVIREAQEVA